jgi:hypothetical protein
MTHYGKNADVSPFRGFPGDEEREGARSFAGDVQL